MLSYFIWVVAEVSESSSG